jgi:hypothetical protein
MTDGLINFPKEDWLDEITRRRLGITYTPDWIVEEMIRWAKQHGTPKRVVDTGAGTGLFTFAAAEAFPDAEILAIEVEPRSAKHLKKSVGATKHASRIKVLQRDYLHIHELPIASGTTLFIGNPPYVRHHLIGTKKKQLYLKLAREFGLHENTKAGLHLHFFLKTRKLAQPGDYGIFIAAAEWIHADYGGALRALLLDGMGGLSVDTFAAKHVVFPDVMTTAAIVCFEIGSRSSAIAFSEIADRETFKVGAGTPHSIATLQAAKHWSGFARGTAAPVNTEHTVQLRDIFRVKRGQVTGAKKIWVLGPEAPEMPARLLLPSITSAKEIVEAQGTISTTDGLRLVVDLPLDFASLAPSDREAALRFREWARGRGGDKSYIARQRAKWWSVQLYEPAPIICTYMGRRPPVFAVNTAGVRHLNIAHGLYPRAQMTAKQLQSIVDWLNINATEADGRLYAGALIKFEPSDIGVIRIPVDLAPQAAQADDPRQTLLLPTFDDGCTGNEKP